MPQFDFATLFSVTASLAVSCYLYYSFFSLNLLSEILILSKFRAKTFSDAHEPFLAFTVPLVMSVLVYRRVYVRFRTKLPFKKPKIKLFKTTDNDYKTQLY